jgi:copper chaperone CopZ
MINRQLNGQDAANNHIGRSSLALGFILAALATGVPAVRAQDRPANPRPITHRVTGLFCPEREDDLRAAFKKLPRFKLIAIDYDNAEVTVAYDPDAIWPGEKPERHIELFSEEIARVSRNTFRAKPRRTKPIDQLKRIQIPVAGLDCLGCSFGAYRIISELPGVETATADFKRGLVTALIDPEQTGQAKLESALTKAGVELASPRP